MSRFLSHLAELQPEMFAEISPELAREFKIRNGDHVCMVTLRARSKRAHSLVAGLDHCSSMAKQCTRSRCLIIMEQPVSCAAARPMIFSRSPANRMSQSWKPRLDLQHRARASAAWTRVRRVPEQTRAANWAPVSRIPKNLRPETDNRGRPRNRKEKNERASNGGIRDTMHLMYYRSRKHNSTNQRRHILRGVTTSKSASSPIRLYALVAKRARSRAKNGTKCPTTALPGREIPTTTRVTSAHLHGVTLCSSSRIDKKEAKSLVLTR